MWQSLPFFTDRNLKDTLGKYCAALANEGGGSIVLGVTDRRPRRVVGSAVFENLERTKAGLVERLRLRVDATEIHHPDGRVVVFTAPARTIGVPVSAEGAYWMRAGEDLAPMTADMLRAIFDESRPGFSAEVCDGATLSDLDHVPAAAWPSGSDRDVNKMRLLQHIIANGEKGAGFDELRDSVPSPLGRDQIKTLLKELKEKGAIVSEGTTRASKWYAGRDKTQLNPNDESAASSESEA
ncbi:MAG: ATP-binding protein [Gammaproteobacteria bacterium]